MWKILIGIYFILMTPLFAASTGGGSHGGSGSNSRSSSLTAPHSGNYGGSVHRPGDLNARRESSNYGYGYRGPNHFPGLEHSQGHYPSPSFGSGGENVTATHYGHKKRMVPHPGHLPSARGPVHRETDAT